MRIALEEIARKHREKERLRNTYRNARLKKGITLFQLIYGGCGSGCLILVLLLFILPRSCRSTKEELTVWTGNATERLLIENRHEAIEFYLDYGNIRNPQAMTLREFANFIDIVFLNWRRHEWSDEGPRCAHVGEMRHNEEHYLAWAVALTQATYGRWVDFGPQLDRVIAHLENRIVSMPRWQFKNLRNEILPLLRGLGTLWKDLPQEEKEALYPPGNENEYWPKHSKPEDIPPLFRRHEIDPSRIKSTFDEH